MRATRVPSLLLAILGALATAPLCVAQSGAGPVFKVLHAFSGRGDGGGLWGSLVLDGQGDLFGTTFFGGPKGAGTVFEMTPQSNGTWALTTIHAFSGNQGPGGSTAGLIFDSEGNLYGSTGGGSQPYLFGTVFELKPSTSGWNLFLLHGFGSQDQAKGPYGGVAMDQVGNVYGVGGSAFKLSRGPSGWQETILHQFDCLNGDGCDVFDHPILDAEGNLYGTTQHGGTSKNCDAGCGTVFELQHLPDGTWKESILRSFGSTGDGAFPGVGALIIDKAGNLYGTTDIGGTLGGGTVFKLMRGANGQWGETILHNFALDGTGDHVSTGVVMDAAGNLYGTTIAGGDPNCGCGVVYKLFQCADGTWMYTVLHRFTGLDGAEPDANLIIDGKGNLYGTTPVGGVHGAGVVFEVTP
jgi:uncharacterized repeat protein (TIGR03803 family)